jgi:hypothetical protein
MGFAHKGPDLAGGTQTARTVDGERHKLEL